MTALPRIFTHALAVFALVASSGCVFTNTPAAQPGDISFRWNFGGRACTQVPEVTRVVVEIPGQTLQNGGVYNCSEGGADGIRLLNFRAGSYDYVISGQNAVGLVIYQASGTVRVNGNVDVNVTLNQTSNATGVYVSWVLPAGTTVNCQSLAAVDVAIDGATTPSTFACADGLSPAAVFVPGLSAGTHTIEISARDSTGLFFYSTRNTFQASVGQSTAQTFTLQWIVGSLPLRWTFSNGTSTLNCAQAGVSTMQVTLRNAQGDNTFEVPCQTGVTQGYQVPYVYWGDYSLFLQAVGAGNLLYRSNFNAPATVTVTAGVFPQVDSSTPLTLLTL